MNKQTRLILFTLILAVGIFVRAWRLGMVPPGLNQDEASHAVDAYDLYYFGMDRNGMSYPLQFAMWGSGQSFLYEYLLMPLVPFGLTSFVIRFPMLLTGILTLPLIYMAAKELAGERFALLAMFLLAISPWHIMLSRWALEDNLLPLAFLAGFFFFLKSRHENYWFLLGCAFFASCLYIYGAAYVAVPIFLVIAVPVLLRSNTVSRRNVLRGGALMLLLCVPIALFILINSLKLETIHVGLVTIPRFPVQARYETLSVLFGGNHLENQIFKDMLNILIMQTDGLLRNSLPTYGYLYKATFPTIAAGVILLITYDRPAKAPARLLLLAWLVAALAIGTQIPVIINRIHLVFIPLLLCAAYALEWIAGYAQAALGIVLAVLLLGFALFARDYFGPTYKAQMEQQFFAGFVPALEKAQQAGDNPICVTDQVNMPYIYALLTEKTNPADFLRTVKYVDPNEPFRQVRSFGRYTFGLSHCPPDPDIIYVLDEKEEPPFQAMAYQMDTFNRYKVYIP